MKATAKHSYSPEIQQLTLFEQPKLSKADRVLIESVQSNWVSVDTEHGFVYRHDGKLAKGKPNHDGYLRTGLTPHKGFYAGVFIHRIVAYVLWGDELFYWEVNHINEIKADNRAENLELITHDRNMQHSMLGDKNHATILSVEQVVEIRQRYSLTDPLNDWNQLAREYGVGRKTIWAIANYKTRKYVP